MNPRRLYRCRHDRMLAGVAGGMAEYLAVDPTVVRILWILSALFGGFTILLYIILAFIIPLEPVAGPAWTPSPTGESGGEPSPDAAPTTAWSPDWHQQHVNRRPGRLGLYVGVMLVVFGAIAMADVLIPGMAAGGLLGAGFLVALGVALLVGALRPSSVDQ